MPDVLPWFLQGIQSLGAAAYALLFLVTFGESLVLVGLFVPGTVVLLVMGGLSSNGHFNPLYLALAGFLGAIAGNIMSYEMGRLGRFHVERLQLVKKYIGAAKEFFRKHHGKSVIICRFVGPVRPFVPFVAGVMDMKRTAFYGYTIIGALLWITLYLSIGYAFGYAWKSALTWSSAGVTTAVVVLVVGFIIVQRMRRKRFHV